MAHDRDNGKCYFGSTFQPLEKRIKQHIYYSKKKARGHFYSALSKRPDRFFWLKISEHEADCKDRSIEDKIIKTYWGQDWLYNQNPQAVGFATGEYNPNQTQAWKDLMKKRLSGKNNPMHGRGLKGSRNGMFGTAPWENRNGKGNRAVWKEAKELFELWNNNNRPGARKLEKLTNGKFTLSNLIGIHKKFRSGWNPSTDEKYLSWCNPLPSPFCLK